MNATTYITLTREELNDFARKVAEETVSKINVTPRYYTIEKAADNFNVTPRTIQNWIAKGVLTPKYIGGKVLIPAE